MDSDGQDGRCWGCGYLLRGVESPQCPECGRGFDRADRSTMNFGRPMGRAGRWMVSGLGRGGGEGWAYGFGQRWVATTMEARRLEESDRLLAGSLSVVDARTMELAGPRERVVLLSAMTQGGSAEARVHALRLFAEGAR